MGIIIEKEKINKLLDGFKWSYSRINSFVTCPHMFYKIYIEKVQGNSNAFAQYGTFLHQTMELCDKGELAPYELVDYYKDNYSKNVTLDFPPNAWVDLSTSYYEQGIEYLSNFDGYTDDLIGAEERIDFVMEHNGKKINFVGIIDRLSRDDNGIKISDYKSKKFKSKKEEREYFRQLYVYSICVKEKYGEYPYLLKFHLLRDWSKVSETLFDEKTMQASKEWVFDTVDEIYNAEEFKQNYNDFFCKYICSVPPEECDCKGQDVKGGSWY